MTTATTTPIARERCAARVAARGREPIGSSCAREDRIPEALSLVHAVPHLLTVDAPAPSQTPHALCRLCSSTLMTWRQAVGAGRVSDGSTRSRLSTSARARRGTAALVSQTMRARSLYAPSGDSLCSTSRPPRRRRAVSLIETPATSQSRQSIRSGCANNSSGRIRCRPIFWQAPPSQCSQRPAPSSKKVSASWPITPPSLALLTTQLIYKRAVQVQTQRALTF